MIRQGGRQKVSRFRSRLVFWSTSISHLLQHLDVPGYGSGGG